ncbi:DUF1328 family protein [Halomicroarcula sp. GCM10025817]|uniref:DUF1328 family protein n=1 Tax=Haloarcula TaxID=2237 RepID=UPI003204CED6
MLEVLLAAAPLVVGGEFLSWAIAFFAVALVAGLVGFRGVAGVSMEIARLLVLVFLVLAVVAFLL